MNSKDLTMLRMDTTWRPATILTQRKQHHTLINRIKDTTLELIKHKCQYPPHHLHIRSSIQTHTTLSTTNLNDIISYGNEINDNTMLLYMELLCHTHNLSFLYTDFYPRLQRHGWNDVSRYFAKPSRPNRQKSVYRPAKSGEHALLIPIHIHGCHWIALTRREQHNRVFFYYSDDMNNVNDEKNIRNTIYHHTDQEFCPPDAIWVNCSSTYYIDHSNECGVRTILALHVMALHPNPYKEMLLPLMHENLAQIARTCLAASLLTGNTMHDQLQDTFLTTECKDTRPSNRGHSFPSDIINWGASYPYSEIAFPNSLPVPEHPPVHISQLTTETEDHPTSEYTHSQPSNEIEGLTYQDIQPISQPSPTPDRQDKMTIMAKKIAQVDLTQRNNNRK